MLKGMLDIRKMEDPLPYNYDLNYERFVKDPSGEVAQYSAFRAQNAELVREKARIQEQIKLA